MSGWVEVSFRAKLPDGMIMVDVDDQRSAAEIARLFGFVRVENFSVADAVDPTTGDHGLDDGPRYAYGGQDRLFKLAHGFGSPSQ